MRLLFISIVFIMFGIASGIGFKLFLEPWLLSRQDKASQVTVEESKPDTSGFAPKPSGITPPVQFVTAASSATVSATLSVTTRSDKKAVVLRFENLAKVLTIDYEVGYVAGGIAKGVTGSIVRLTESSISREILLGTCSQGVCTYDTGVKSVDVSATFTFEDRKTSRVEKTHTL